MVTRYFDQCGDFVGLTSLMLFIRLSSQTRWEKTETCHRFGLGPVLDKTYLPDLVIFLNPSENLGAIRECTSRNVPTIGIVDTDTDPRIVTYAIPANMDVSAAFLLKGHLTTTSSMGRKSESN